MCVGGIREIYFCNNVANYWVLLYLCTALWSKWLYLENFYPYFETKNMRYIFLTIASVVLIIGGRFCTSIQAMPLTECPYNISGTVTDTDTSEPLLAVLVQVLETQQSVLTDSMGNYRLSHLCKGNYTLVCSHVACQDHIETLVLQHDTIIHISMPHQNNVLQEIQVGSDGHSHDHAIAQTVVSQQDFDQRKNQNLAQALSSISGVNSLQTGNSIAKPVIHGLHSQRVLVLNNGVRQEGQQWGAEHAPEIDILANDRVAVVKGAAAIQYGSDAIAGIVLTEANPLPQTSKLAGSALLMGNSNGWGGTVAAKIEAAVKKIPTLAWRLQGTLQRSGNVQTPNYYLANTATQHYNFSYNMGYSGKYYQTDCYYSQYNAQLEIFSGSHIGNLTDLQQAFLADRPFAPDTFSYSINRPKQKIEHELVRWRQVYQSTRLGKWQLLAAYQFNRRSEYDVKRSSAGSGGSNNLPDMQLVSRTITADLTWQQTAQKRWNTKAGMNALQQDNFYAGRNFVPPSSLFDLGVFVTEQYQKQRWQLEVGLRFDHKNRLIRLDEGDTTLLFNGIATSVSVQYHWNEAAKLSYQGATTWRPPHPSELYSNGIHHGAASYELGDATLKAERSIHQTLQLEYKTTDKIDLEVSIYYNYMPTFIFLNPTQSTILTIAGAFPVFQYQQTRASLAGADFDVQYKISKNWQFIQKTSYLYAYNHDAKTYLINMPPMQFSTAIQYNFKNSEHRYNTYLQLNMTNVLEQKQAPKNQDFVPPPKGYTLLNVYAATTLAQQKYSLKLVANVNNLLNTVYRNYLNRFRYYADEMGVNANVGVTFSW